MNQTKHIKIHYALVFYSWEGNRINRKVNKTFNKSNHDSSETVLEFLIYHDSGTALEFWI